MSFEIHIPDAERAYLDALPLSTEAKTRINRFVEQIITTVADEFRLDPQNRPTPDEPFFLIQYLILDRWGDGHMHTIDFHIRDDKAAFGVLLMVFIDHQGSGDRAADHQD